MGILKIDVLDLQQKLVTIMNELQSVQRDREELRYRVRKLEQEIDFMRRIPYTRRQDTMSSSFPAKPDIEFCPPKFELEKPKTSKKVSTNKELVKKLKELL
jgi:hypothetical protein